jgi:protein SCO1/2
MSVMTIGVFVMLLQSANPLLSRVGVDQKIGDAIDPAIVLRDEDGRPVRIGDLFGRRPLLLTPVYYECPMLCSLQLNALVRALKVMPGKAGESFDVITFSVDPRETPEIARRRKEHYLRDYGRPQAAAGWRFLTGDAESIERLTRAIGFRFALNQATGQIAHVSTLVTLTPDGRISQYFNGIEYDPADLKASLAAAAAGKTGSWIEQALLYCYEYDPATGRYSLAILRVARLGGVATMVGLVALGWWASRARRRRLGGTG